jgi:hypothetical protein
MEPEVRGWHVAVVDVSGVAVQPSHPGPPLAVVLKQNQLLPLLDGQVAVLEIKEALF